MQNRWIETTSRGGGASRSLIFRNLTYPFDYLMNQTAEAQITYSYDYVVTVVHRNQYALRPALAYGKSHCRRDLSDHGIGYDYADRPDYDIRITAGNNYGILACRSLIGACFEHRRSCLRIGTDGGDSLSRELRLY